MRNVILIVAAAGLLAACAQSSPRRDEVARKDVPPHCLQETGSRIERKPGECNNNPGRVVTREEMERTGAFTTFDAIQRTVPQAR